MGSSACSSSDRSRWSSASWHPESRGGVCAAGSLVPARAHRVHAGGREALRAADAGDASFEAAGNTGAHRVSRRRTPRAQSRRQPRPHGGGHESGLRDVHVGIHGPAQRRVGATSRGGSTGGEYELRAAGAFRSHRAGIQPVVRCRELRVLGRPAQRRGPDRHSASRPAVAQGFRTSDSGAPDQHAFSDRRRSSTRWPAKSRPHSSRCGISGWRRGVRPEVGQDDARIRPAAVLHQRVRADRERDVRHVSSRQERPRRRDLHPDRPPYRQYAGCTFSIATSSRFPSACRASCTSAGPVWRGST